MVGIHCDSRDGCTGACLLKQTDLPILCFQRLVYRNICDRDAVYFPAKAHVAGKDEMAENRDNRGERYRYFYAHHELVRL